MPHRILNQIVLPVLVVCLGAGGLAWLNAKNEPPDRVAWQPTAPLVETVSLQSHPLNFQITFHGNVVPSREVLLSAEVDGRVTFKGPAIESGRYVLKKTPLLQFDRDRIELQLNKIGRKMEQVEVDLRRLEIEERGTKALIELAKREAILVDSASKRLDLLDRKKVVSAVELEATDHAELQSLKTLQQLLNQSELIPVRRDRLHGERNLARLEQQEAQLQLDHTNVVAPFSGVITDVMVEKGDYVQVGDPLLKLVDLSTVDVECSLQLEDLYWLWDSTRRSDSTDRRSGFLDEQNLFREAEAQTGSPGNDGPGKRGRIFEIPDVEAVVTSEIAGERYHWKGRLARYVGHGISQKTRTVLCRVHVSQPIREDPKAGPPALMRGMYVSVTLHVKPRTKLIQIPTRGVQPNGQVFTVEKNALRVHSIRPVKVLPESVLVRADATDLKAGDRVVVTQLTTPLDGTPVREAVRNSRKADAAVGDNQ